MANKQSQDLGNTVLALTRDSLLIQQRLDAEHEVRVNHFAALLASAPEAARSLLMPLAPNRLVVQQHAVACRLQTTTTRTTSFEITFKPLNVGMAVLYGSTATQEASLSVEVRCVCTPDTFTT